jgi:hypothetical protein
LGITITAATLAAGAVWWQSARLGDARLTTGATLLGCIILLTLIGVRRRLPVLPIGSMATWTQVHLYTGVFTCAIYALHVPAIIGTGGLESILSITFLLVAGSGIYGIHASRTIPKRLTAIQGQHHFDQVGWHRDQINQKAHELMADVPETPAGNLLTQHFQGNLQAYFASRARILYLALPSGNRRRRMLTELRELNRYLDDPMASITGKLSALVRHRDDIDYQFALQLRLRIWVAFHAVMSVLLLVFSFIHGLAAFRFAVLG